MLHIQYLVDVKICSSKKGVILRTLKDYLINNSSHNYDQEEHLMLKGTTSN